MLAAQYGPGRLVQLPGVFGTGGHGADAKHQCPATKRLHHGRKQKGKADCPQGIHAAPGGVQQSGRGQSGKALPGKGTAGLRPVRPMRSRTRADRGAYQRDNGNQSGNEYDRTDRKRARRPATGEGTAETGEGYGRPRFVLRDVQGLYQRLQRRALGPEQYAAGYIRTHHGPGADEEVHHGGKPLPADAEAGGTARAVGTAPVAQSPASALRRSGIGLCGKEQRVGPLRVCGQGA